MFKAKLHILLFFLIGMLSHSPNLAYISKSQAQEWKQYTSGAVLRSLGLKYISDDVSSL